MKPNNELRCCGAVLLMHSLLLSVKLLPEVRYRSLYRKFHRTFLPQHRSLAGSAYRSLYREAKVSRGLNKNRIVR